MSSTEPDLTPSCPGQLVLSGDLRTVVSISDLSRRQAAASHSGPVDFRHDRPHAARMYDYYLGGKDNYPADREAAERAVEAFPNLQIAARENRALMRRAAGYLARAGFRQFLDIGTGIPTSPNLHEVVQGVTPDAAIVYVDNDPLVLLHSRALMTSGPQGRTAYVDADIREPAAILRAAWNTLDPAQPVALSLIAVLHFLPDAEDPYGIVAELVAGLPEGSAVMLSHVTADFDPEPMGRLVATYQDAGIPAQARSVAEIARFTAGLQLVEPGITSCQRWHPEIPDPAATGIPVADAEVSCYAAVARA